MTVVLLPRRKVLGSYSVSATPKLFGIILKNQSEAITMNYTLEAVSERMDNNTFSNLEVREAVARKCGVILRKSLPGRLDNDKKR